MESSIYPNYRTPGDCRRYVRTAILYTGDTTLVPIIDHNLLKFPGGTTVEQPEGIAVTGPSADPNPYAIPYDSILPSGTRIRSSFDATKKKYRLALKNAYCGSRGERLAVEMVPVGTCEFPTPNWDWYEPIEVGFECNCLETPCQRINKLAREINLPARGYFVTATAVNVGTDWFLDIEVDKAGQDFKIVSSEGFQTPRLIVPQVMAHFTAAEVAFQFPFQTYAILSPATKKMTAVELYFMKKVPRSGALGAATSNELGDTYTYEDIQDVTHVFFDTTNTNSNNAYIALLAVLAGTNEYNKKIGATTSNDGVPYNFTVTRTDAGDPAALTTTRANYTTNIVDINRLFYLNGVSYYILRNTTGVQPAGAGSDVVTAGAIGSDGLPVTADTCPTPENSLCAGCL